MSELEAIAAFKCRAIALARSLPITEARVFLKGLLLCATEDVSDIRSAYSQLCNFDDQLELIASAQLQFRELQPDWRTTRGNTCARHAEVGEFLRRHKDETDFEALAAVAIQEGLYSPRTAKSDIASRLRRFAQLHPSYLNDPTSKGELLRS